MILVFDLDDTLYDESTYVLSGLKAVAKFLNKEFGLNSEKALRFMNKTLAEKGRGAIFDDVLKQYNFYSKKNVRKCVSVYRLHEPNIELSAEGISCLRRFNDIPKYLVTDGHKIVQQKKIEALKLSVYFKKMFRTYQYGLKYSKPSTFCFDKICELENTQPKNVVYIGDNPNKDFVGIKKRGYKTIRVRTGCYKNVNLSKMFEAEYSINTLDDLDAKFLKKMFN